MTAPTASRIEVQAHGRPTALGGGLRSAQLRSLLDAIDHVRDDELLAVGGSAISSLVTPTSDFDFFHIGRTAAAERLRRPLWSTEGYDIETRSPEWLADIRRRLETYSVNVACEMPPFDPGDLQFLTRILRGRLITASPTVRDELTALKSGLERAVCGWASVVFVTGYQDLVGLLMAGRADEALTTVGPLVDKAATAALFLRGLTTDVSTKWGSAEARRLAPDDPVRLRTASCLRTVRSTATPSEEQWLTRVLQEVRSLVADAVVRPHAPSEPVGRESSTVPIEMTAMPTKSGFALYNVLERRVRPASLAAIAQLVQPLESEA